MVMEFIKLSKRKNHLCKTSEHIDPTVFLRGLKLWNLTNASRPHVPSFWGVRVTHTVQNFKYALDFGQNVLIIDELSS